MEQIIKGWVFVSREYGMDEDEIFLVKNDSKTITYENDDGRQLRLLIGGALEKLGFSDIGTDDEYEDGVSGRYFAENISMQLFASDKRMKLDEIREYIVLDSMGLLEFQEGWYGYSSWTIEGYSTENFTLGGHDILEILKHHKGKFVYLVIDRVC